LGSFSEIITTMGPAIHFRNYVIPQNSISSVKKYKKISANNFLNFILFYYGFPDNSNYNGMIMSNYCRSRNIIFRSPLVKH